MKYKSQITRPDVDRPLPVPKSKAAHHDPVQIRTATFLSGFTALSIPSTVVLWQTEPSEAQRRHSQCLRKKKSSQGEDDMISFH